MEGEVGEHTAPDVLENQRRLDVVDLRQRGEAVDGKLPEVIGIPDDYVDEVDGLRFAYEPETLRFFQARFGPVDGG